MATRASIVADVNAQLTAAGIDLESEFADEARRYVLSYYRADQTDDSPLDEPSTADKSGAAT